jgi:hypothetical protein
VTATLPPRVRTLDEILADRYLPGPTDEAAWADPETVLALAGLQVDTAPATEGDLLATYGTADPAVLRASFALADDVALAERLAAGSEVTR